MPASTQHPSTGGYPKVALSVSEFCAATSISRAKFYEEVAAKRIRILKSGRRTLIPVSAMNAWLSGLKAA